MIHQKWFLLKIVHPNAKNSRHTRFNFKFFFSRLALGVCSKERWNTITFSAKPLLFYEYWARFRVCVRSLLKISSKFDKQKCLEKSLNSSRLFENRLVNIHAEKCPFKSEHVFRWFVDTTCVNFVAFTSKWLMKCCVNTCRSAASQSPNMHVFIRMFNKLIACMAHR